MKPIVTSLAAAMFIAATAAPTHALTDAELQALVDQRLAGDRTGACMAVAVVEKDQVARTYRCADAKDAARIDADTAFEIGSVSKTMAAVLLADLIEQGRASLDDPLADYLPEGTVVPAFEGQPILLRHVVTHTSGLPVLPSRLGATDMRDPYVNLDEEGLLASLGDVSLSAPPGTSFEYSNFASMLLSYALARMAESDFESMLKQRLFAPLGMDHAYINAPPEGVRAAIGHTPNTQPTPAWNFSTDLAGVGGVRATLDDMVAYVKGNLGLLDSPMAAALALAQLRISEDAHPAMAMNWMLLPVEGRTVHVHEGGTGGFSAFVSVDRELQRGAVILSDTAWNSIGNLGSLGLHLVDPSFPLGEPRKLAAPSPELLDALEGEYRMPPFPLFTLRQQGGALFGQVAGQAEFEMAHDDRGDFFPVALDALLRPQRRASGEYGFTWMQMGGVYSATRIAGDAEPALSLSDQELAAFVGEYPLMPNFVLSVRSRNETLHAQATGQGEFPLAATGKDRFEAAAFGIELLFKRDAEGEVVSLELHQAGHVLSGQREQGSGQ